MPLGGSGGESTSGEDDTRQREEEELVAARESEQPEVEQRTCAGVGGERWISQRRWWILRLLASSRQDALLEGSKIRV